MVDSHSRVVSALNFLTGEGILYLPNGADHILSPIILTEATVETGALVIAMNTQ